MATEYNKDTLTLTIGGQTFKLDEEATPEVIRTKVADIVIGNKKVGDFYNPTMNTYVNVASVSDESEAMQRVSVLEKLLSDIKTVSTAAIGDIVNETSNVSSYEAVYLNFVKATTMVTKIIAGVLILQNVGSQLCSLSKKDASSPKLEDLNNKIDNMRALLNKTTRLLFTMDSLPQ